MGELRVWAPKCNSVAAELSGRRIPMVRGSSGWWSAAVPDGCIDYAFVLDGAGTFPDPRSPWQPCGVHGPSRTVDHAAFRWSDRHWQAPPLESAIFYELHIGTFTEAGTFAAAMARIPHLRSLGVTHVELMPVAEFSGDWGWGYDGVDLYAPHHAYGSPDALKRLVDALHANGLAVILDVVYNHLGPVGNYLSRYGPYFTDKVQTPWGNAVNLSGPGSDGVRAFFIENALMWLRDYHFDGLRLDAVHALADSSAVNFLEELAAAVRALEKELHRPLCVIAESDLNDPRLIRSSEAGGYNLCAQWSDDFHHALHAVLTGERTGYYGDFGSLAQLAKAIERGYVYDGQYSAFRERRHGRPLDPALKNRLLGYLQNHDQIGNRARGERIDALANRNRVKIGTALALLGPFVPLLFQGEEWGAGSPFQYFTHHDDPALGRAVSEGRRREFAAFGWPAEDVPDPQAPETFRRSKLDWAEVDQPPHCETLRWCSSLIQLRKSFPELRSSRAEAVFDEQSGLFVMDRGVLAVACNLGAASITLADAGMRPLPGFADGIVSAGEGIVLPPDGMAILTAGAVAEARFTRSA